MTEPYRSELSGRWAIGTHSMTVTLQMLWGSLGRSVRCRTTAVDPCFMLAITPCNEILYGWRLSYRRR